MRVMKIIFDYIIINIKYDSHASELIITCINFDRICIDAIYKTRQA